MRIDVLTIFPEMFASPLEHSILGRAREAGLLQFRAINIRDYAVDRHRTVDDAPFGGGAGMVMKPEPIFRAVEAIVGESEPPGPNRVILMAPLGQPLTQEVATELAQEEHLVLICGRYEGIDERVHEHLVTDEISIGDYVLTGGELAALVMIDAAARLVPGVLGDLESAQCDSFADGLLDYPHYTRPLEVRGMVVPEVLVSGNHQAIERWRRKQALRNTRWKRPDLLEHKSLSEADAQLLDEVVSEGMERQSVPCLQEGVGS